jgi:hypothetical protein
VENIYACCMAISTSPYCWGDDNDSSILHDTTPRRSMCKRGFFGVSSNENRAVAACGTLAALALKNRL